MMPMYVIQRRLSKNLIYTPLLAVQINRLVLITHVSVDSAIIDFGIKNSPISDMHAPAAAYSQTRIFKSAAFELAMPEQSRHPAAISQNRNGIEKYAASGFIDCTAKYIERDNPLSRHSIPPNLPRLFLDSFLLEQVQKRIGSIR